MFLSPDIFLANFQQNSAEHTVILFLWLAIYTASFQLNFISKEIEENNRMGKSRDLFEKIRDTKQTFHAKMGSIKDRNGMDLTEAEDIKKRWQEYTEEIYKKRS